MANYIIKGTPDSITLTTTHNYEDDIFAYGTGGNPNDCINLHPESTKFYYGVDLADTVTHPLIMTFHFPPLVFPLRVMYVSFQFDGTTFSHLFQTPCFRFHNIDFNALALYFAAELSNQADFSDPSYAFRVALGNGGGIGSASGGSGPVLQGGFSENNTLSGTDRGDISTFLLPSWLSNHYAPVTGYLGWYDGAGKYLLSGQSGSIRISNVQFFITDSLPGNTGTADGSLCIGGCTTVNSHSMAITGGGGGKWQIVGPGGVIASDSDAQGWTVTYSAGPPATLTVCAPCGAVAQRIVVAYQVDATHLAYISLDVIDCNNCNNSGGGAGDFTADNGLTYEATVWGRHRRAVSDDVGNITYSEAPDALPLVWSFKSTGLVGFDPCVRGEVLSTGQVVYLSYTTPVGAIKVNASTDGGETWGSAMTVSASGDHGAFVITRHGTKHFFWRTSGGAIQGTTWDGANNVIESVFTAVASGVDSNPIAADEFLGANGEHRIGLLYRASGAFIFKSAVDGKTFS